MHLVSKESMRRLRADAHSLRELKDKHESLARRFRALEAKHQEVILALGLHGLELAIKPAVAERVVLKKVRAER